MEAVLPVGIALILAVIAWKIFKGLVKIGAIVALFAIAGFLYWQGVI